MKPPYAVLFTCCLVNPLIGTSTIADETFLPVYSAQGILEQTISHRGANTVTRFNFELLEDSKGCWRLTHSTTIAELSLATGEVIAYDGTNIYSVITSNQTLSFPDGKPKLEPSGDRCTARVAAGPYPIDYGSAVGALWLAFLSGRYLSNSTSVAAFPNLTVSSARIDPAAWSCDLVYTLTNSEVHDFLQTGVYRINRRLVRGSAAEYEHLDDPGNRIDFRAQQETLEYLRDPSFVGVVPARFELDETRLFRGIRLPKSFHLSIEPILQSKRNPESTIVMTGLATNFSAPGVSQLLPPLKGLASVQDRRFRVKHISTWRRGVMYGVTNKTWILSTNDPRLAGLADRKLSEKRYLSAADWRMEPQKPNSKWTIILVLTGMIFPAVLMLYRRLRAS